MAQSVIHDPAPCYQPGDTISVSDVSAFGYVTSGTKNIHITFITPKSLKNISSINVTRFVGLVRGISGYVNNISDASYSWLNSGFTPNCYKEDECTIRIVLASSAALTNVTNNTPVVFDGSYTFALS